MTREEEIILGECLKAAVYSTFFDDWEFHTIFGLTRDELREIYLKWPNVDFSDETVISALHNSVNNLTGYPIGKVDLKQWNEFISISREELTARFPKF